MTRVLLIDDDERLAGPLASFFARFDIELVNEIHPESGLKRLMHGDIDLVILDVMLPDQDGFEVCRVIRRQSDMPILMLTARGDVMDRVVGLELGADDYLAKPFEPRELVARVQNILRRSHGREEKDDNLDFGDLVIDRKRQSVSVSGFPVSLTTREYQLLELLASAPARKFSRDQIISALRGTDAELFSRAVDIAISRLRQKLKPTNHIRTVWGFGYTFVE